MQPADKGYFHVFKSEWKNSCSRFTVNHPGIVVTKRTFSRVFMEAYDKASRHDVIKGSFKASGIWPVNRNAIERSVFAPAKLFVHQDQNKGSETSEEAGVAKEEIAGHVESDPERKDDGHHPIHRSLEEIEKIVGRSRRIIFEQRLTEGYDVAGDALYDAWKTLKQQWMQIQMEIRDESFASNSSLSDDLCPIIERILTYPEVRVNQSGRKAQNILPRHMTSNDAIQVLELKEAEKRRVEIKKKQGGSKKKRKRWRKK